MVDGSMLSKPAPGYLDRYPAKMVSHLAASLVDRYAHPESSVLDPFCGSGAVLCAARDRGLPVAGVDLNPYAVLLTKVKLDRFDVEEASRRLAEAIKFASSSRYGLPINWSNKSYWFTRETLAKFERLREASVACGLARSNAGRAALLAMALAIRRCSRADQRSPKPFISHTARLRRIGKHFDPYVEASRLLSSIATLHGGRRASPSYVLAADVRDDLSRQLPGRFTLSITSPPYINAQDYFRNFKLELYFLEGLLPFRVADLCQKFVGTERGDLGRGVGEVDRVFGRRVLPVLRDLEKASPRHAAIVYRYLADMRRSFDVTRKLLAPKAKLVLVCGDNLVAGRRIDTSKLLTAILRTLNFRLVEQYGDPIERRYVPPVRHGHRGLIKHEIISCYQRI